MKFRKWIAVGLALCMMLPNTAMAVDVETEPEFVFLGTGYIENPYGTHLDQPSLISDEEEITIPTPEVFYETKDEAAQALLTELKERDDQIVIGVTKELYTALEEGETAWKAVFDAAIAHDPDDPKGGDYTGLLYDGIGGGYGEVGSDKNVFVYMMTYRTTAEEEAAVDEKVTELVTEWKSQDLSQYDTIQTIYDYITANVTYDNAGLNDEEDVRKYTAYGALCEGSAVCMGISILFYRLALEMGVDARFIQSIDKENHAWNIVKFGDFYYNLDATWDLDEKEYDNDKWYLKNMADFQVNYDGSACHTRNEKYLTDAFMEAYPMAETSYTTTTTQPDVPETEWDELTWQFDGATGTLTVSGQGVIPGSYDEETGTTLAYPWQAYVEGIRHVVIDEGITEMSYGMLEDLQWLETLSLPSTLVELATHELSYLNSLEAITIDANNPKYFMQDGVLFSNENGYCTLENYLRGNTAMSYSVPDTVDCINTYAFSNHEYLQNIYIPASVTKIWGGAFRFCFALSTITVAEDNPNYVSVDGILYTKDQKELLVYPYSYGATAFTVPDTVTKLTFDVFQTEYMERLTITKNVSVIEGMTHAISDYALQEIVVVEENPNYCSIDGVLYSKDMTTLYWYPARKTDTVYHIPDTVKRINTFSLFYTQNIQTLYMGAAVETIDYLLLVEDTAVTSVYFPGDLPDWFAKAFSNMADQVTFYYPEGASGWASPTMELGGVTYNTATYTRMTAEDLTGDGTIDADDLVLLQDYFSGKPTVDFDTTKADYNGDGKFTRADVMYLARALAKWEGYSIADVG